VGRSAAPTTYGDSTSPSSQAQRARVRPAQNEVAKRFDDFVKLKISQLNLLNVPIYLFFKLLLENGSYPRKALINPTHNSFWPSEY
jgi:hypothetical protein